MLDQIIDRLDSRHDAISVDFFNNWKRNAVTERLFHDLTLAVLGLFQEGLPESVNEMVPVAFQREGAKKMLDVLADWMPEEVRKELESREAEHDA